MIEVVLCSEDYLGDWCDSITHKCRARWTRRTSKIVLQWILIKLFGFSMFGCNRSSSTTFQHKHAHTYFTSSRFSMNAPYYKSTSDERNAWICIKDPAQQFGVQSMVLMAADRQCLALCDHRGLGWVRSVVFVWRFQSYSLLVYIRRQCSLLSLILSRSHRYCHSMNCFVGGICHYIQHFRTLLPLVHRFHRAQYQCWCLCAWQTFSAAQWRQVPLVFHARIYCCFFVCSVWMAIEQFHDGRDER